LILRVAPHAFLDGTMSKSKEMISGVADCDTGLVQLFSMVKR
jgi:hypothetical protein